LGHFLNEKIGGRNFDKVISGQGEGAFFKTTQICHHAVKYTTFCILYLRDISQNEKPWILFVPWYTVRELYQGKIIQVLQDAEMPPGLALLRKNNPCVIFPQ
jgi:hypothetical protein